MNRSLMKDFNLIKSVYVYIYIYIYRERERERDITQGYLYIIHHFSDVNQIFSFTAQELALKFSQNK